MSVVFLDAAMGTRLADRGYDLDSPLWSALILDTHPEAIAQIHTEDIEAGANVITTNTFRTTPYSFHNAGYNGVEAHNRARALTLLAIRIAWKCVKDSGREVRIAGSIAPLADCYKPKDYPGNITARPWHDAQLDNLDHQATDLILVETMNSAREARLLTELSLKREKPVWVSFTLNDEGQILNGDDLTSTAIDLERMGAEAIGINCCPPDKVNEAIKTLREAVDVPILAYPNLARTSPKTGKLGKRMTTEKFSAWSQEALELGASIIGACCGSDHEHVQAAAEAFTEAPAS